jgi:hypothetical protein
MFVQNGVAAATRFFLERSPATEPVALRRVRAATRPRANFKMSRKAA